MPDHAKRQWRERLDDRNPFKTISANHDLVRATRLAWIEAAQEILEAAREHSKQVDGSSVATTVREFDALIVDIVFDARDLALDRRKDPGASPIDADVEGIINGMPELVSPGIHAGIGSAVTSRFVEALAELR